MQAWGLENTSRDREVMIGKIMIARMMPPMRMLRPGRTKVAASPAGHQEYFLGQLRQAGQAALPAAVGGELAG